MSAGHVTTALPLEPNGRGSRGVVCGMCVHTTPPCRTPDRRLATKRHQEPTNGAWRGGIARSDDRDYLHCVFWCV